MTPERMVAAWVQWSRELHTAVGGEYSPQMRTRLRHWFMLGIEGQPRPVVNSNYDRPLVQAYRAGRAIREGWLATPVGAL